MAIGGSIGEAIEDGLPMRAGRMGTAAERRAAAQQRESARRENLDRLARDGRLCGWCAQFEAVEDRLCKYCLDARSRRQEQRAREQAEQAILRQQSAERGIVVGASVTRKRGGGHGTVVEVFDSHVRVAWHGVWGPAGWGRGGSDHRTYVRASSLVVTPVR